MILRPAQAGHLPFPRKGQMAFSDGRRYGRISRLAGQRRDAGADRLAGAGFFEADGLDRKGRRLLRAALRGAFGEAALCSGTQVPEYSFHSIYTYN